MPIVEDGNNRYIVDDNGEVMHKQTKREVWLQPGETVGIVKPGRKRDAANNPEFIKTYRTNIIDIVTREAPPDKNDTGRLPNGHKRKNKKKWLSTLERAIFLSMMVFIDWESNYIVHPANKNLLNDTSLGELIGYDRGTISETTNMLANKGLISIIKNGNGRGNSFMINTNIVFNGRKMKDLNDCKVFQDCPYKPITAIKYQQSEVKKKK